MMPEVGPGITVSVWGYTSDTQSRKRSSRLVTGILVDMGQDDNFN